MEIINRQTHVLRCEILHTMNLFEFLETKQTEQQQQQQQQHTQRIPLDINI